VTFDVDANGILNVSARDKDTGAQQGITISEGSNLERSEVERMLSQAERNRAQDQHLRQAVDARNELDAIAYQVERRLSQLGDGAPAHERARAELLVGDARAAVKDEAPVERVRTLTSELQQIYQALAARQPGQAGSSGSPGQSGSGQPGSAPQGGAPGGGGDDEVIDAEFDRS
jgi:molecular chaperone DnaK